MVREKSQQSRLRWCKDVSEGQVPTANQQAELGEAGRSKDLCRLVVILTWSLVYLYEHHQVSLV
jgi:hypothetical protein